MTVPTIAAVALAMLAAVLAIIAWRQRRALLARSAAPGGDSARAMLAALREPALLHGERIEAVNDAFSLLTGLPADRLVGRTLAELVSGEYAELATLAVARALAGEASQALTEVELADPHGKVKRLEMAG